MIESKEYQKFTFLVQVNQEYKVSVYAEDEFDAKEIIDGNLHVREYTSYAELELNKDLQTEDGQDLVEIESQTAWIREDKTQLFETDGAYLVYYDDSDPDVIAWERSYIEEWYEEEVE